MNQLHCALIDVKRQKCNPNIQSMKSYTETNNGLRMAKMHFRNFGMHFVTQSITITRLRHNRGC